MFDRIVNQLGFKLFVPIGTTKNSPQTKSPSPVQPALKPPGSHGSSVVSTTTNPTTKSTTKSQTQSGTTPKKKKKGKDVLGGLSGGSGLNI